MRYIPKGNFPKGTEVPGIVAEHTRVLYAISKQLEEAKTRIHVLEARQDIAERIAKGVTPCEKSSFFCSLFRCCRVVRHTVYNAEPEIALTKNRRLISVWLKRILPSVSINKLFGRSA